MAKVAKEDGIIILATVAARGGSKGVKNKNTRDLLGKPLIAYTIEQVMRWGKYDKFIVSTDSKEISKIALEYGADVPFMRPAELATDTAAKLDVLRHALIKAESYYNIKFDALLDLDATSPIRTEEDIENIVTLFKEKKPDCIFSVVKARRNPYFNMVEKTFNGRIKLCKKIPAYITRRQDAPLVYEMNASMYVYSREYLLNKNNKTPFANRALLFEMKDLSRIDIDTELDFRLIEFLIKESVVKI